MKKLLLISLLVIGTAVWGQEQVKLLINGEYIEFVAFDNEYTWESESDPLSPTSILLKAIADDGWVIDWGHTYTENKVEAGISRALRGNGYRAAYRIVRIDEITTICYFYSVAWLDRTVVYFCYRYN
jgi:hypothetical protein